MTDSDAASQDMAEEEPRLRIEGGRSFRLG